MTDIIYLLYLAEVVEEIRSLSIATLIFCSLALIVHMFIVLPGGFLTKVQYRVMVSLMPVCLLVFIFMPGKNIVYSLAAIKAGEVAINSEAGQLVQDTGLEALKALVKSLKDYNAAESSN